VFCSLFFVLFSLFSVLCSLFYVLWSLFCVRGSVFCVLCSVFCVLCSVFCGLSCALLSVFRQLCVLCFVLGVVVVVVVVLVLVVVVVVVVLGLVLVLVLVCVWSFVVVRLSVCWFLVRPSVLPSGDSRPSDRPSVRPVPSVRASVRLSVRSFCPIRRSCVRPSVRPPVRPSASIPGAPLASVKKVSHLTSLVRLTVGRICTHTKHIHSVSSSLRVCAQLVWEAQSSPHIICYNHFGSSSVGTRILRRRCRLKLPRLGALDACFLLLFGR